MRGFGMGGFRLRVPALLIFLCLPMPSVRPFNVALRAPLLSRAPAAPHCLARPARDARVRLAGASRISASLPPLHPSPPPKGGASAKIAGLVLAGFLAGMVGVSPVHASFGPGAASVTSAPDVDYSG